MIEERRGYVWLALAGGGVVALLAFGPPLDPRARAQFPAAQGFLPPGALTQTFRGQRGGLDAIHLVAVVNGAGGRLHVRLERKDGRVLLDQSLPVAGLRHTNDVVSLRFPADDGPPGGQLTLYLRAEPPTTLLFARGDPGGVEDGDLRLDGVPLEGALQFEAGYRSLWRAVGLGLLVAAPVLVAASLRRGSLAIVLALTGALTVVGLALWQRDYRWLGENHYFPDGYDEYSRAIQDVLTGSGADPRGVLHRFVARYPHAHSPLLPVVLAVVGTQFDDLARAYAALSALAAVASAAVVFLFARRSGLSRSSACGAVILAATSFLFVRAAARTSTDMPGLLTTLLGLGAALELIRRPDVTMPRRFLSLALLLTIGAFVRPTVLAVGPAIGLAGLAHDRFVAGKTTRTLLWILVSLAPGAAFFVLSFALGFGPSFAALAVKATFFSGARTAENLLAGLALVVGVTPALWVLARRKGSGWPELVKTPETILGFMVFLTSIGFLVSSGAPFWSRHFLPALAGLVVAALTPIKALEERSRGSLEVFIIVASLPGLAIAAGNLFFEIVAWSLWYRLT